MSYITTQEAYLCHHGVKGMKWGVRKDKVSGGIRKTTKKLAERHEDNLTRNYMGDSQQSFVSKLSGKHRYDKEGISEEEAREKAKRRMKAEKYVAVAAGVTVASLLAYSAYKHVGENYVDSVIRSGTDIHTITLHPSDTTQERIFGAFRRGDRQLYRTTYGRYLNDSSNNVFDVGREAVRDIRVPSRRVASRAFLDLYNNDSETRERTHELIKQLSEVRNSNRSIDRAARTLASGGRLTTRQLLSGGYDAFNTGLVDRENNRPGTKFYERLKSMGYGALLDTNDVHRSGYNARSPMIIFDMESVVRRSVQQLSEQDLGDRAALLQDLKSMGKDAIKPYNAAKIATLGGVAYGLASGSKTATYKKEGRVKLKKEEQR